jgi:hypothetical protein
MVMMRSEVKIFNGKERREIRVGTVMMRSEVWERKKGNKVMMRSEVKIFNGKERREINMMYVGIKKKKKIVVQIF